MSNNKIELLKELIEALNRPLPAWAIVSEIERIVHEYENRTGEKISPEDSTKQGSEELPGNNPVLQGFMEVQMPERWLESDIREAEEDESGEGN